MEESEDESDKSESQGFQPELIRSYMAFGRRAIRSRWYLAAGIFVVGVGLTLATLALFPKTYKCKTVMMALGSSVLDRYDSPNPLAGAEGLIMRHDNLEGLIRSTKLLQTFGKRRPPLLRLKDRVMAALVGQPSDKMLMAMLVGTLDSKLEVSVDKGELSIAVEWSDAQTAAELVDAARESFLNARHTAEVSAFEDKMAILDGHAVKLREEVAALADQMNSAAHEGGAAAVAPPPAPGAPRPPAVTRVAAPRAPDAVATQELADLRERLAVSRPKLNELENEWSRRLRDEQGRLAEMKLRLTPNHPEVVTEQEKVAMLSQVPAEVGTLRAEVNSIEAHIKGREALGRGASTLVPGTVNAEPLPPEIIQALEKDNTDPALRAQLSGAVSKYGDLRDGIRSGRIDLDTAQAAFNHRYQVVLPAEVPTKAEKPKPVLIIGGGLALTLLLALLLPILGELRQGVMIERWQVQHLQLPVLAELELPPHSD